MVSIEVLRAFFGWCAVFNIGMLIFASLCLALFQGPVMRIHQKLFALEDRDLKRAYFQYLAQYKIATLVFNLVPYFALWMVG